MQYEICAKAGPKIKPFESKRPNQQLDQNRAARKAYAHQNPPPSKSVSTEWTGVVACRCGNYPNWQILYGSPQKHRKTKRLKLSNQRKRCTVSYQYVQDDSRGGGSTCRDDRQEDVKRAVEGCTGISGGMRGTAAQKQKLSIFLCPLI